MQIHNILVTSKLLNKQNGRFAIEFWSYSSSETKSFTAKHVHKSITVDRVCPSSYRLKGDTANTRQMTETVISRKHRSDEPSAEPERPEGASLHALFPWHWQLCAQMHAHRGVSLHHWNMFSSELEREHTQKTDHTEHLIALTLFICYGKLPLTSACWAFDLNPELLTVFNASLIIQ